ncbi:MAG: hypothetical protein ACRDSK_14925 [Actinophytocola sp.]|uniref:hypothetical protein n=1 Tax=Actinophytocola sp. TaxID=1872138 RepID=UPI003D6AA801
MLAAVHRQAEHPPMPLAELVALLARASGPEPRRPSRRPALVAAAVVAVATLGVPLLVVLGEPAESSVRRRVCAQDLLVRSEPARPSAGARRLGLLERGDAFDLERTSADGVYAYGYAHGSVNINGWVDSQWLCPPD